MVKILEIFSKVAGNFADQEQVNNNEDQQRGRGFHLKGYNPG